MKYSDPWVVGTVVSSFDETKGPIVNYCYPPNIFSASLLDEIKMMSLPRASNFNQEDCYFVFRVRANEKVGYLDLQFYEHEYLYGYVYFQYGLSKD